MDRTRVWCVWSRSGCGPGGRKRTAEQALLPLQAALEALRKVKYITI